MNDLFDVLIIGGSHAGLSAAMALSRLQRTVLVVDSGTPRNLSADHANNIPGADGTNPQVLRDLARDDLKKYDMVNFVNGLVIHIKKTSAGFTALLDDDTEVAARKVILAHGIKDKLPGIEGLQELWGHSVFHCPFCHGYEFRDKKVAIWANAQAAEHVLPMMRNLTSNLMLFTRDQIDVSLELNQKLEKFNIPHYDATIVSIERNGDELRSVTLANGETVELDAILIAPDLPFELKTDIGNKLGCDRDDQGLIKVTELGQTSVSGVFAAGDIVTFKQSVVGANASGQNAGAAAVFELSQEDFCI